MLVDSHCHLDFPDFEETRDDVVARAVANGVTRMVTICTRPSQEPTIRAIAEKYEPVFYAAGAHPLNVGDEPVTTTDALIKMTEHPKMVGIGETGLDYHYDKWPPDLQKQSFRLHIDAARETGLPLIIHSRNADGDMAAMLGVLSIDVRCGDFQECAGIARHLQRCPVGKNTH